MFAISQPAGEPLRRQRQVRPGRSARPCARSYEAIVEGYHLNKRHWITVILDADVPDDRVRELVRTATTS